MLQGKVIIHSKRLENKGGNGASDIIIIKDNI